MRPSARALITLTCTAAVAVVVVLLVAVTEQTLRNDYPAAMAETIPTLLTVGLFLICVVVFAVWLTTGWLLNPLRDLRRDVALSARARAVSQERPLELEELHALRITIAAAIQELESRVAGAELEQRRVLGLFEATSEGILQIGANGRFTHVNAAARKLLALPGNAEGQSISALIRNGELRDILERAVLGQDTAPGEVVLDGRQLLVSPQVLRAGGETVGAVVTVVDLTELRRLEGVRRDFVANVSHELKTPLTSIRGYVETLLADPVPHDVQVEFLEVVLRNAVRLQRLVEDLLDLSRLQSGGWQPELEPVSVTATAQDVWAGFAATAADRSVTFEISGPPVAVCADEGALRQVLSNVFENALRHTPPKGRVEVSLDRQGDVVEILVRDTGSGIPRDALPRIFERFYRVDPARSRAEGGTGLGLSIVKHLVERMEGTVSAESEIGKGTTIRIVLPSAA